MKHTNEIITKITNLKKNVEDSLKELSKFMHSEEYRNAWDNDNEGTLSSEHEPEFQDFYDNMSCDCYNE